MALPHAAPGEPIDVRPLGGRLAQQQTAALFKSAALEVIRLVLPAGRSLPPHKVAGEITIHCIEGRLIVIADGAESVLEAGEMLYLGGDVMHGVRAVADSSALVTIALQR